MTFNEKKTVLFQCLADEIDDSAAAADDDDDETYGISTVLNLRHHKVYCIQKGVQYSTCIFYNIIIRMRQLLKI